MGLKTKRNYIEINPSILTWARGRARYSVEELAKKISTSPSKYKQFETGEASPTMRQFYMLAKSLNRSAQLFFKETLPVEPDILTEMRRLPGSEAGKESASLAHRISLILDYREMTLRLYKDLKEKIPTLNISARITDNPDDVASKIRDLVNINIKEQASWKGDKYKALRGWRAALEDAGVMVFHIPLVSLEEMRGLSIPFDELPIIGVNSKDFTKPKIFTIFHELTHILIGERFLDSSSAPLWELGVENEIEYFCNSVSAATLIPKDDLLDQTEKIGKTSASNWEIIEITKLSTRYAVSYEVVTRRLHELNKMSSEAFFRIIEELRNRKLPKRPKGGNPYRNRIAWVGGLLSELAFRGYYQNVLTESDLSSIFGLQVNKLGKMEEMALGVGNSFGE